MARSWMDPVEVEAAMAARSQATICLVTALQCHDLTIEPSGGYDLALPRGVRPPRGLAPEFAWHQFDRGAFDLGREKRRLNDTGLEVWIYSPERTICDVHRMRGYLGYEVARDALKEWLRQGGQPSALAQMARHVPGSKGPVLEALWHLEAE